MVFFIHTCGSDQDIGHGLSHKVRIIELYLQGETYYAIMGKSRHSAFSVKRYMCSFSNILLLVSHEMVDVKEISRLLGQSEHLAEEGFQYHGDGESNGHGSEYSYTVSYFYIIISS